jgi:hypothetical protein
MGRAHRVGALHPSAPTRAAVSPHSPCPPPICNASFTAHRPPHTPPSPIRPSHTTATTIIPLAWQVLLIVLQLSLLSTTARSSQPLMHVRARPSRRPTPRHSHPPAPGPAHTQHTPGAPPAHHPRPCITPGSCGSALDSCVAQPCSGSAALRAHVGTRACVSRHPCRTPQAVRTCTKRMSHCEHPAYPSAPAARPPGTGTRAQAHARVHANSLGDDVREHVVGKRPEARSRRAAARLGLPSHGGARARAWAACSTPSAPCAEATAAAGAGRGPWSCLLPLPLLLACRGGVLGRVRRLACGGK